MVIFSKCLLIEVEGHVTPIMIRDLGHRRSGMLILYFVEHILLKF